MKFEKENIYIQEILDILPNIVILITDNNYFYGKKLKEFIINEEKLIDNEIILIDNNNEKYKNETKNIKDFFNFIQGNKNIEQIIFRQKDNLIFFDIEVQNFKKKEIVETIIIFKGKSEIINNNKDLFKINNKIHQLKYIDSLTKLNNRTSLMLEIGKKSSEALILINIDNFKEINNFYGFIIGDKIIKNLSQELKTFTRKKSGNMQVYKLPSDEFGLLVGNKDFGEMELINLSKKIINYIQNKKLLIDNQEIRINISIGISNFKEDLLGTADMALKTARFNKKDFVFFNIKQNIREKYENNIKWINKLKNALENDNVVPFYQAIINNKTMQIEKYECLVRLIDENNCIISPFHFLNIAKKSRLYLEITKVMILKSFQKFENLPFQFTINLSIEDLTNEEIKSYIIENLQRYKIGEKVVFEILESEGIENYDEVSIFIKEVKRYGCKIAIDDFGSGYSNFEHVLQLNVDFIKIDGSLIKNLMNNKNNEIVIETINEFSKKLGIKTVAEFVFNKDVMEKVRGLNIDFSQGYFFHEPSQDLLNSTYMGDQND